MIDVDGSSPYENARRFTGPDTLIESSRDPDDAVVDVLIEKVEVQLSFWDRKIEGFQAILLGDVSSEDARYIADGYERAGWAKVRTPHFEGRSESGAILVTGRIFEFYKHTFLQQS